MKLLTITLLIICVAVAACGDDDDEDTAPTQSASATEVADDPTNGPTVTAAETTLASENFQTPVTTTVGPDWMAVIDAENEFIMEHAKGQSGPPGMIAFLYVQTVYNPNDTSQQQPAPDDMLQWLRDHPGFITTNEEPVTIDGFAGTRVEVRGDNVGNVNIFEISDGPYELNYNERSYMYVLDVGGQDLLIHSTAVFASDFDEFNAIAEPIVLGAEIEE